MEVQVIDNPVNILLEQLPGTFTRREALKATLDMDYSAAWLGSQLQQLVLTGALKRIKRGVYKQTHESHD